MIRGSIICGSRPQAPRPMPTWRVPAARNSNAFLKRFRRDSAAQSPLQFRLFWRLSMNLRVFAAVAIAAVMVAPASAQTRQQVIRERSTHVMPFSMDATMHQFEPTKTGGFMVVTVHDGDARQIALVREHLQKEAAAFARGDYADPAYIHGNGMPGLAALSAGAKRI